MFEWFKPRCPVDAAAKQWIEERLHWLSDQFGHDTFTRRAVLLPTNDFFPDPMDGTEASVRNLLDQVCKYMDVNPNLVELEIFTNANELWLVNDDGKYLPTGAAGLYDEQVDRTIIHIETSEFMNLAGLVGTMAHELAHLRLMGERRVTGDEFDNELLTDLTAVFHGFGIFLGNSPRNWDSQYSNWRGTDLKRPEYMTLPMFAYALAHTAWFRDQPKPDWYPFLSFDLKPCFKQGLRYLMETQDSTFNPQSVA
ncbi:hypothetical protein CA13_10880 [Planctomycetes bacterium CA13]|uniref:Uncharacterized protein n=1 Tax=Novipirellula herctigrandis TaxID=2527986 RepID=A0A5C5YXD4_9BACT|nr:hypothetical protein CA13_10880 [Planctomycetes bacterium CA13]